MCFAIMHIYALLNIKNWWLCLDLNEKMQYMYMCIKM